MPITGKIVTAYHNQPTHKKGKRLPAATTAVLTMTINTTAPATCQTGITSGKGYKTARFQGQPIILR